jgi:hypothetical protein
MKNNLLTEIKHIKHLMGLNEANNQECEKQLEDAGYVVYNKTELKTMDADCENNKNIKCVKKWMDDNGIDSSRYRISKHMGICYLVVQSEDKITHTVGTKSKEINKRTYAFWDNGDITYVRTFDEIQTDTEDDNIKYSQVQFKGKYECDGSDIKWKGLNYQGVYNFNNFNRINKKLKGSFMTKKGGADDDTLVQFASTNATLDPANI